MYNKYYIVNHLTELREQNFLQMAFKKLKQRLETITEKEGEARNRGDTNRTENKLSTRT